MSYQIEIYDDITGATFKNIMHQTENLEDGAEVELLISSYGGEILYCMSIIDALKRFHTKANVIGFACSAAAILAISCEECSMSENASMLIHSAFNDENDADDPGIKRCNELQLSIIRNRCPDFNPKDIQKDTWLSAEDCLKLHLVDNIYITDAIDYLAICKRYAAKLSNIYNISSNQISNNAKETTMDEKVNEMIEEVKEEKLEEQAEEPKVEEPENHDLLEVVEKLTEELNALKARVLALEEPEVKEEEEVKEEIVAEEDPEQERINNIYKNIMKPQARVAIGTPKAASQPVVNKVDYKAFKTFLNN